MCDFVNKTDVEPFIHPILKAIILHFWLAYEHPFIDGNGRVARSLFYWFLLRQGYWIFEFISISEMILKAPMQYAKAFLYTETDENDLTYFILHQVDVIEKALQSLQSYIEEKNKNAEQIEKLVHKKELNHRPNCPFDKCSSSTEKTIYRRNS